MYSYEELMNMDETRLRELASSMGMKKTTSADQQELAYYVIDSESENTAKELRDMMKSAVENRENIYGTVVRIFCWWKDWYF